MNEQLTVLKQYILSAKETLERLTVLSREIEQLSTLYGVAESEVDRYLRADVERVNTILTDLRVATAALRNTLRSAFGREA
jgi:hypothetical protein